MCRFSISFGHAKSAPKSSKMAALRGPRQNLAPILGGAGPGYCEGRSPLRAGTEGPDQGIARAFSPVAGRDGARGTNILID